MIGLRNLIKQLLNNIFRAIDIPKKRLLMINSTQNPADEIKKARLYCSGPKDSQSAEIGRTP